MMRVIEVLFCMAGFALCFECSCNSSGGCGETAPETHTTPARDLTCFEARLSRSLTPQSAEKVFGKPDRIEGSGLIIYVYLLDDGQEIWIGFPGYDSVLYAKLKTPDGQMRDLELK